VTLFRVPTRNGSPTGVVSLQVARIQPLEALSPHDDESAADQRSNVGRSVEIVGASI
jgi:hypothetical protein